MDDERMSLSTLTIPESPTVDSRDATLSPSASAFLRTAATLEGLSRQLGDLQDGPDEAVKCCCGSSAWGSCAMNRERERLEDKLKLSAEIGNALLQRYEALEKKLQREVERYERQLEVKRTALAESVRRVNNLEKANTTHMQRYADVSKKTEAMEKRYTQSQHTQTLTQQSLTHVRAELTELRKTSHRQSLQLVTSAGDKTEEAERRYEEQRDLYDAEVRKAREDARRRKRLEARIEELETQLAVRTREVDEVKEGRARDAKELLANAKDRLATLHQELSHTFKADSPEDMPEYHRALEDLVASNALLKHDASELSHLLSDSREEVRVLKDELDELRASSEIKSSETASKRLAAELSMHTGNDSSTWRRESRLADHYRKSSLAPSFASLASSGDGSLASPGLGMGPIGEYDGALENESPQTGRESPKPVFRSSPSGGIGYVLNGVPKKPTRPGVRRSITLDKARPIRTYSPSQVDEDEPLSPASDYFRSLEQSRKRRSLLIKSSPRESTDFSTHTMETEITSPMSDSALSPNEQKRVHRRTLVLLTKSVGTQTESDETPRPNDASETSSIHERSSILALLDHLGKILTKLRSADVPTLNKRLKKQHLPGDVAHLSRSTMRNLQLEVAELRTAFKGVADVMIGRREYNLLLKMLREVFNGLIELQAVVNDVTIDPHVAKRLQKQAFRDEEVEKGGLGWIAAPLTKFFVTPAGDVPIEEPRRSERRAHPPAIKAPKLLASTSATTTHVSVEFGGAGIVRKATPAAQPAIVGVLPPTPDPTIDPTIMSRAVSQQGLAPPRQTLRPQKSRANRNELLGIFAGAQAQVPPRTLRAVSSQYFGDKIVRPEDKSRKRLSTVVDAVIDRTAEQIDDDPVGSYEPPLLERTLRPRGLSDSSIRSTFIAHEPLPTTTIPARAGAYGSVMPRGYLETFASRFNPFKAAEAPVQAIDPGTDAPPVVKFAETKSPAQPIPNSPSIQQKPLVSPNSLSVSQSQRTGILGMLATSVDGTIEEQTDEEEGELNRARWAQGVGMSKTTWR